MVSRSQKIRLGVFVTLSATVLVGMVAALLGTSLGHTTDTYTTRFEESVSGLEVGAPVKYHGVRVGTVDAVKIDPEAVSEVVVTLSLDHGTPVKEDSLVVLNTMGITGLKFLEISGGTDESRFLTPGDRIPTGPSLIHRLTGKADVITEKVELLVNNLAELTGEKEREQVRRILEDVQETMDSVRVIITENELAVSQAVADLAETAANLRMLTTDGQATLALVDDSLEAVRDGVLLLADEAGQEIRDVSLSVQYLVASVDDAVLSAQAVLGSPEVARFPRRLDEAILAARDLLLHADVHVAELKERIARVARTLDGRVGDPRIDGMLDHLANVSQNADTLVATLDLTALQARDDIFLTLDNLKDVVRNLNDFSQMLLENPSVLLRGSQLQERKL
ncbi:MAG: MCE family protein [Deltaproteobacteria bacterium]|nr:MCE family protein [Deltaproteobacteria bacterium]